MKQWGFFYWEVSSEQMTLSDKTMPLCPPFLLWCLSRAQLLSTVWACAHKSDDRMTTQTRSDAVLWFQTKKKAHTGAGHTCGCWAQVTVVVHDKNKAWYEIHSHFVRWICCSRTLTFGPSGLWWLWNKFCIRKDSSFFFIYSLIHHCMWHPSVQPVFQVTSNPQEWVGRRRAADFTADNIFPETNNTNSGFTCLILNWCGSEFESAERFS